VFSWLARRRKTGSKREVCGDCAFFNGKLNYCRKLWVFVAGETEVCEHFNRRAKGREQSGALE